MKINKKTLILIIIGFMLVLQFWICKLLGIIHITSGWQWQSDLPAMGSVIGNIMLLIGFILLLKANRSK